MILRRGESSKGADFVAKVGQEQLASKNTQHSNRDEWNLESILRIDA